MENILSVGSQSELITNTNVNDISTTCRCRSTSKRSTKLPSVCFCQERYKEAKKQNPSANTRPPKKHSITRNNQNMKSEDSIKLEVQKLIKEIANIDNDIKNKKKQFALMKHRVKVRQPTNESSDAKNQLSNNNIRGTVKESEIKADVDEDDNKEIIDLMNPEMRSEYLDLIKRKQEIQQKITKEQIEIDEILAVKIELEEQIRLLGTQVFKVEQKIKETEQNRINCENKYDKKTQDNSEITDNGQDKGKNDRNTSNQQRLEQSGSELKEDQFELVVTDDILIKEIHEKIAAFENKLDEIMEVHNDLDNFIRKNQDQINFNQLQGKAVESIRRVVDFQNRTNLIE